MNVRRAFLCKKGRILSRAYALPMAVAFSALAGDVTAQVAQESDSCHRIISDVRSTDTAPQVQPHELPKALISCIGLYADKVIDGELILNGVDETHYRIFTRRAISLMDKGGELTIEKFRSQINELEALWVLAAGAVAPNAHVRVNSLRILGNVLDNSTMCVALDQAYRTQSRIVNSSESEGQLIRKGHYYIVGRANLLSVLQVVASYAFEENAAALERLVSLIRGESAKHLASVPDTDRFLRNIQNNVDKQRQLDGGYVFKDIAAPEGIRQACLGFETGKGGGSVRRFSDAWTIYDGDTPR